MATRRSFIQHAALGGLALNAPGLLGSLDDLMNSPGPGGTPPPSPQPSPPPNSNDVGQTLIDYSAGVPSGRSIKNAGYRGVIRYMSERRESWMLGKPMRAAEVADMKANGLVIVSCYQFGKGATSDWRAGFNGGVTHAAKGIALHQAAGGPSNVPIYAAIDDNPTSSELELVAGYIRGWESVIGKGRTGVYANYPTIDFLRGRGLGTFFWMHNWGSGGRVHPAAHIHQFEIDRLKVDGIGIDRNRILKANYGQW
ncbi:DUF1906 domain-containing protein [Hoyosella altamirensis]|uniref:Rv2525c-like glycoside hydrolase-like domain-containing protein n=1 Tax=Hoyosella altamirensis TaxID=616997 RepID=A0A839RK83_9ACTN|nr:DUF1906 domain-containing protein [Hoyosella altamirensis]MBB3037262.1 hypothetical protein [Hoyosella altamirensis]